MLLQEFKEIITKNIYNSDITVNMLFTSSRTAVVVAQSLHVLHVIAEVSSQPLPYAQRWQATVVIEVDAARLM